jgi:glyoxylate reductase
MMIRLNLRPRLLAAPYFGLFRTTMSSSTKPFILLFNSVRHAKPFYEELQKVARTEVVTSKSREEFFTDVGGKYTDISVIYRTSASGAVS